MKLKKLLSFALALAMVLAFVPAMSLTASAAEEQTLWDINTLGLLSGGSEITPSSTYGLTSSGYVRFNTSNWVDGAWTSGTTYDSVLTFFKSTGRSSTNETEYVTFDDAALTKGAESVTIDFAFATRDGYDSNYETFSFYDNDGKAFASFYFDNGTEANNGQFRVGVNSANYYYLVADNDSSDDRAAVNALRGVDFRIKAEKDTSGYTVTYSYDPNADGVYTAFATEAIDSVNGIWKIEDVIGGWTNTWCGAGLQDLVVTYVMPETIVSVTASYTVGETEVTTATATYDTSTGATAASFDEIYAYYDGEVYYAAATELSADDEIEMSLVEHYTATTESFTYDGISYVPTDTSVIVNGNFITGDTSAWTNRSGTAITGATFSTEEGIDGNVMTISTQGASYTNSIGTSWSVTSGGLYYLSFYVGGTKPSSDNYTYNRVFQSDKSTGILAYGANMIDSTWTKMEVVFTATGDSIYFQGSWASTIKYAAFELIPVEVDSSVSYYSVSYAYEDGTTFYEESTKVTSGTVIDGRTFYADGKIYTTPETTVADSDVVIKATVAQEYAVLTDALVSDNEIWGPLQANSNGVFVAAGADANRGPLSDADGVSVTDAGINPSTLQKSRVGFMQFALPELTDGQTAQLVMPVYDWHDNTFSNGNTSIRISAYVMEDDSWTSLSDGETYTSSDVTTIGEVIFSDVAYQTSDYITMDVTDAIKRAKAAGLSNLILRLNTAWGAAYISDSESAVFGGDREGLASYITISDGGYTVTVNAASSSTLTVNGSQMSDTTATVNSGDYIYAYGKDYYYDQTSDTVYDGSTKIEVTSNLDLIGMSLGVELADGAQIRIGDGVNTESKIDTSDSGIRFIATVDTLNTLAGVAEETGIAIWDGGYKTSKITEFSGYTLDNCKTRVLITDDSKWQGTDIFSVAITNIAEGNFNRIYIAAPYVIVNGETYYGNFVARTPYEVAAGILTSNDGDTSLGDYEYSVEEQALYKVLNAYANQTGARITLDSGYKVGYAEYANGADAFFSYSDTVDNGDGSYTITLTAKGSAATFYDYAEDYYRINNAKEDVIETSGVFTSIKATVSEDGSTLTITFTVATE